MRARSGISAERERTARIASSASSSEEKVERRIRSTPSSRRIRTCSVKISRTCAFVSGPYGLTSCPSGPTSPATRTYSPSAADFASRTASPVDLLERVRPVELRQLRAIRIPRVRREDLRPGRHVVVVDLLHEAGRRDAVGRTGAVRRRPARDEQRPHRPVREEDVVPEPFANVLRHVAPEMKKPLRGRRGSRPANRVRPRSHLSPVPERTPVPERDLAPGSGSLSRGSPPGCRGFAGPVPPAALDETRFKEPRKRVRGRAARAVKERPV